jgi:hypothetical protein
MAEADGTASEKLAEIAAGAHGVVTRPELLAAGLSNNQIYGRLRTGSLHCQYPGVYRVGHEAPSLEATYLAAVLACGPEALLCGLPAGLLLELIKRKDPPTPEVLARSARQIPGITIHRARRGPGIDRWEHRGVPVTSPARTLVDLAAVLSAYELGKACHEARFHHGTTPSDIEAVLARRPGSKGAGKLRRIIHGDSPIVLSRMERRFIAALKREGLPLPKTNRLAGGRRVDCRWPDHRLTVELDSYTFHNSKHSWELDRKREREARARGDEHRRYSYDDVTKYLPRTLADLRRLLGRPIQTPVRAPSR